MTPLLNFASCNVIPSISVRMNSITSPTRPRIHDRVSQRKQEFWTSNLSASFPIHRIAGSFDAAGYEASMCALRPDPTWPIRPGALEHTPD